MKYSFFLTLGTAILVLSACSNNKAPVASEVRLEKMALPAAAASGTFDEEDNKNMKKHRPGARTKAAPNRYPSPRK